MTERSGERWLDKVALRLLVDVSDKTSRAIGHRPLLIRSTSFGDFATFLPFLAEVASWLGRMNISLLLLSRHGKVGESILGEESGLSIVTFDASHSSAYVRNILRARRHVHRLAWDRALFCGPSVDLPLSRVFRRLLVGAIAGSGSKVLGFAFEPPVLIPNRAWAQNGEGVVNQAMMPFDQFGITPTVDRSAVLEFCRLSPGELANAARFASPLLHMVGIHVGSRLPRKRWPLGYFTELIRRLLMESSLGIVFVGGSEDLPAIHHVMADLGENDRLFVAAGSLSLRESIAIGAHLSLLVGNDGAPVHLCALGGCPVVSLFCSWEPPGIWEPIVAPGSRSLRPARHFARAVDDDYGISALSVDMVEAAALEMLGGARDHQVVEFDGRAETRRRLDGFPF